METNTSIKYFPGFNALRFLAASLVIFHHIEQYKFWLDMPNNWGNALVDSIGHRSVSFFFVLSGFLITYLLLKEREMNGFIHIGKFYMRRALRIWPLYFGIVLLTLFVTPVIAGAVFNIPNYTTSVVLCLVLFLPNLLRVFMPNLVGGNQLWSVGVEEQFYFIWPVLVGFFSKRIIPFLLTFIGAKFLIHILLLAMSMHVYDQLILIKLNQVIRLYELFPVEQMAVGGLGAAFIYLKKAHILKVIYRPISLTVSAVLISYTSLNPLHFAFNSYIDAIMFCVIIMNVTHYKFIHRLLESRLFKYLGDISYGIYMWHTLIITVLLVVIVKFGLESWVDPILYVGSFIITVLVAHLSYQYFEKPFLRFKNYFSFERVRLTRVAKE